MTQTATHMNHPFKCLSGKLQAKFEHAREMPLTPAMLALLSRLKQIEKERKGSECETERPKSNDE
jgi:hypothetical protein